MEPERLQSDAWPKMLPPVGPLRESRRVDMPVGLIGMVEPPCLVQMKFQLDNDMWTAIALADPGKPTEVAKWLKGYRPKRVEIAPGIAPRALRARFESLPERLAEILAAVKVRHVLFTPQGACSFFIAGDIDAIKSFTSQVQWGRPEVRVRPTLTGHNRAKLTPRQLEIVSLAVGLGYYEIPRKIDLRTLAKKAGISLGAVSELLRRGESMIVTDYIDSLAEAQWDLVGEFDDIWPEDAERESGEISIIARQRVNSLPGGR